MPGVSVICSLPWRVRGEITDILSHAVGLLAPFGEALEQVANARWHRLDGIGVVKEENLKASSSARVVAKPQIIDPLCHKSPW